MNKFQFTKQQWEELISEFDRRCVRCALEGYNIERDHIIPLYQGGNCTIDNTQPLCAWCNSSKGPENFNWKEFRRKDGWNNLQTKLPKKHPYNVKNV